MVDQEEWDAAGGLGERWRRGAGGQPRATPTALGGSSSPSMPHRLGPWWGHRSGHPARREPVRVVAAADPPPLRRPRELYRIELYCGSTRQAEETRMPARSGPAQMGDVRSGGFSHSSVHRDQIDWFMSRLLILCFFTIFIIYYFDYNFLIYIA